MRVVCFTASHHPEFVLCHPLSYAHQAVAAAASAHSSSSSSSGGRRRNAPLVFAPGNTGSNLTLTIAAAVAAQLPGCNASAESLAALAAGVPLLSYLKADAKNLSDTLARARCALNAVRQSINADGRFTLPEGVAIDVVGAGVAGDDDGLAGIMAGSTLNDGYSLLLDWLRDPAGGGYTPGADLFGAPYNWMASEQGLVDFGWWDRIKATIVRAYNAPSNARPRRRVVLLSHSMGAMVFQTLIAREPEFARRYVAGHVAVGGPYGGAAAAWGPLLGGIGSLVASGFDDGTNGLIVRYGTWAMMQTSAALVWTMPYSPADFGSADYGGYAPDQVILRPGISRAPNRTYDVASQTEILSSFFRFINPDDSQSGGKLQFLVRVLYCFCFWLCARVWVWVGCWLLVAFFEPY
jgi:hypothetical protein